MSEDVQPKVKKPNVLNIARQIRSTIEGDYPKEMYAPFPHKFHVLRDSAGITTCIEEFDDGVIAHIGKEKIHTAVINYVDNCPILCKEAITVKDFMDIVKYFVSSSEPFPHKISPVLQKLEPGYTYHRLPFDFTSEGDYPLWKELLGRMSNAEAFMSWVGSLFDPHSDRSQYLWLHGDGRNGKSTIGRFLQKVFGAATGWEVVPTGDGRFWPAGLVGKRIVIFGDCNHYSFPMSGLFKTLTGDDEIRIERKHQPSFASKLVAKFMFFSNDRPEIESKNADTRRLILCQVGPVVKEFGNDYEQLLWAEASCFLKACVDTYNRTAKESGVIPCDKSELEEITDFAEDQFDSLFERNFEAKVGSAASMEKPFYMRASEFYRLLKSEGFNRGYEQRKFYVWLQKKYGASKDRVRVNGRQLRIVRGIRGLVDPGNDFAMISAVTVADLESVEVKAPEILPVPKVGRLFAPKPVITPVTVTKVGPNDFKRSVTPKNDDPYACPEIWD